ncbi:hypothetical protein GGI17_001677 [Coemansia sp. S146]|nr:hypothetical protein GGI17_001677 [Coemansia sp. S146]
MEQVAQMKSSRLIPRLCQGAYCAGPPHLIATTISEKKQACMLALKSANSLQQANAVDAALMALNKNDVASAIQIALVIDKIYTQCLGRRSLKMQLTPRALE